LLSFFSSATLASNPYDEFLILFSLPEPTKKIVESFSLKEARANLEIQKEFFKKEFYKFRAKFNSDKTNGSQLKRSNRKQNFLVIRAH
jgi:hypothetical protein